MVHFPIRSNLLHPFVWRAASAALVAAFALGMPDAVAAGHSLRFFGAGAGDIDRVKIRIDDPAT
ncbi:MAG: LamG domain-containing protein, partial [Casimicrobiaceae bacterium]